MTFETLLSLCLGLGLSAACGFRIFVPLLAVNLAARVGWVSLSGELAWMGDSAALWAFGVATVLEIGAYYVPWLDNFLDSVATPAAGPWVRHEDAPPPPHTPLLTYRPADCHHPLTPFLNRVCTRTQLSLSCSNLSCFTAGLQPRTASGIGVWGWG